MASKDVDEMSDRMKRNLKRKLETTKNSEKNYSEVVKTDKSENKQVADKPTSSSRTDIIIRNVPTTDSKAKARTTSKLLCNIREEEQKEKESLTESEKQKYINRKLKKDSKKLKEYSRVLELQRMVETEDEARKARKLKSNILEEEHTEKELLSNESEKDKYINKKLKQDSEKLKEYSKVLELQRMIEIEDEARKARQLKCCILKEKQKEKKILTESEKQTYINRKLKQEFQKLQEYTRLLEVQRKIEKEDEARKARELKSYILKEKQKEKEILIELEKQKSINKKLQKQLVTLAGNLRLLKLNKLEQELKELRKKITDVMVGKSY